MDLLQYADHIGKNELTQIVIPRWNEEEKGADSVPTPRLFEKISVDDIGIIPRSRGKETSERDPIGRKVAVFADAIRKARKLALRTGLRKAA